MKTDQCEIEIACIYKWKGYVYIYVRHDSENVHNMKAKQMYLRGTEVL